MSAPRQSVRPRRWPLLLDYGFRPFFLLAPAWAILAATVVIVAPSLGGAAGPWHAREMIFGFGSCVLAGFLLTAVPTWTGRLPLDNGALLGLVGLWALGRVGVLTGAPYLDLIFLPVLMVAIGLPMLRARRWRAFKVAAALPVLWVAQAGLLAPDILPFIDRHRLALAAYGWLIAAVGGRLLAHLSAQADGAPTPPHNSLDRLSLALLLPGLASWAIADPAWPARLLMGLAGAGVLLRQLRWRPWRVAGPVTGALNAAHSALGLALCLAAAGASPALATHLFALCAMGLAMMAAMTRTVARFLPGSAIVGRGLVLIAMAGVARVAAELMPELHGTAMALSGLLWMLAQGDFLYRYAPRLIGLSPSDTGRVK